ncbi:heme peroxidase [Mycena epipterygia]|nr:heme peroxidase [Mycena epipterygia]
MSSSHLYTRLLLPTCNGYPLFRPQPFDDLPSESKRRGTEIGDVGVITPDGAFDVIFNICRAADDPNNRFGVPDGFEQVHLGPGDVELSLSYHDLGTDLSNTVISKRRIDINADTESNVFLPLGAGATVEISTSSKETAVLLLPDGASRSDLRRKKRFRDYALKHAQQWYAFVNGSLERMIGSGDLYLVTGVDKSSSWSVAALENRAEDCNISLKLKASQVGSAGAGWAWEWERSSSSAHSGPRGVPQSEEPQPKNQTVFLRGFRVAIRNPYTPLMKSATAVHIMDSKPSAILSRPKFFPYSQPGSDAKRSFFPHTSSSGSTSTADAELESVEYFPAISQPYHPADAINNYLLDSSPDAMSAVVHDDECIGLLNKNDEELPGEYELLRRLLLLDEYEVETISGAACLRRRDTDSCESPTFPVNSHSADVHPMSPSLMDEHPNRIADLPIINLHPDKLDGHPNDLAGHIRRAPLGFSDLPGYLDAVKHFESLDDRKLLASPLENLVTLMSRLSNNPDPKLASISKGLQSTLIDILYKDLPHPPSSYLSVLPQNAPTAVNNPIKYAYRNADGSNYVPLFPGLGKANSPYARSVPRTNFTPPATLPDAGLVFDTLMRREEFVEHPGGMSALFFAFADLVIHSVFNTSHTDLTINTTSSYLDLSILYGNSQKDVDGPAAVHAPATCALLVLLSRNHNFTAQKILEMNEPGTYKSVFKNDAEKLVQDDEIFNRARLVNCGYFMQIILGDYVGAILGLVRDGYSWRLDPLSQSREPTHELSPRGEGNVVSLEFNLLYRWHAALSKEDTQWTENMFNELFEGKDFSTITIEDFMYVAHAKKIPDPDVKKWTFYNNNNVKLKRGTNGRFKDSDLAEILHNSTSSWAGAYKARGIPEVLRVIEVLGIEQARRWGACSMNDFRRFLGLKPYNTFQEWNPDKDISHAAAALYKDIENLELYVGLQAEETKEPMAGAGLCPGYTISRAILADAVCLTRGDRFLTLEFTPFNLTAWGYRDCQFDVQDGSYGGMLTKLLFRTLPEYYPAQSAYAHFPFLQPDYMRDHVGENNPDLAKKYIWTRPEILAHAEEVVVVKTDESVRAVLDNHTAFPTGYSQRLRMVTGHAGVDCAFVNDVLSQNIHKTVAYFEEKTEELIAKRSLKHIGKTGQIKYVDIVRDVINVLPVHWICHEIAGLPLSDDVKDEQRQYGLFSDVCRYVFLNSEPSNDWRLRESSQKTFQDFEKVVKQHLGSRISDADRVSLINSGSFLHDLYAKKPDLTELIVALFTEVVPTAAHWSQAIAHVVNYYLDDSHTKARQEIVELAESAAQQDKVKVAAHIRAALAVDPPVWGVYRTAQEDVVIDTVKFPVGARVFASIKQANIRDKATPIPLLGIPEHGLLSASLFEQTAPCVLGKILGLKGLQRGPGAPGKFNRFVETVHGAPQQWYINAHSDLVPWPESLVVEYNE